MARLGRQTPTQSVIVPYSVTHGAEAIDLYNSTGRTAQEWQVLQVNNLLAETDDGLWTHTKYGLAVPRRNGKNEVVVIREMYGLVNGERICHTAHRTTTSHSAYERLFRLLIDAGYEEVTRKKKDMPKRSFYASKVYGLESIELTGGGVAHFRTRTNNGGLGEGFDLLVIDEAQEYTEKQESALTYTVTDSKNPQTIFTGTPPTATSGGNVFPKLRTDILSGMAEDAGWAEWSIDRQTQDIRNVDLWYETNPSLGTILTERNIKAEIRSDIVDFNIQRLGLWITYNQKSAISAEEWAELKVDEVPELENKRYLGVKFGHDGANAALAIAAKTKDGRIFVESIDCVSVRAGFGWMFEYFHNPKVAGVAVDGASGQKMLADDMKQYGFKPPILPNVQEIILANSMFERGLFGKTICHTGQISLAQSVSNCEKRAIGSKGGFGYRSINDGIDVSLLDSVILAHWLASTDKERTKQNISY